MQKRGRGGDEYAIGILISRVVRYSKVPAFAGRGGEGGKEGARLVGRFPSGLGSRIPRPRVCLETGDYCRIGI